MKKRIQSIKDVDGIPEEAYSSRTRAEANAVIKGLESALQFWNTYFMFAPGKDLNHGNHGLYEKRRHLNKHVKRHKKLHQALDELLTDAITHKPLFFPSKTSITSLLEWSARQADESTIDHKDDEEVWYVRKDRY